MVFGESQLDRRGALGYLGAGILGALRSSSAARAQSAATPLVGFLSNSSPVAYGHLADAFREGLKESGYLEGKNVAIDWQWAEGQYDRLPGLAKALVERNVAVILATGGPPSAIAAKQATTSVPIVFVIGDDPIKHGLVTSLAHPGKNVTGVVSVSVATEAKRLEVLRELVPKAKIFALLVNPDNPQSEGQSREVSAAANAGHVRLRVIHAARDADLEPAFAAIPKQVGGLLVGADAFLNARRDRIVSLADRASLPAIYPFREFSAAGGLISYGPSLRSAHREAGVYVARILRGAKPAELPVSQARTFEMVLNLKTAKKLRLAISRDFISRVDEIIE